MSDDLSYEEAVERLQETVERLEKGNLPLQQTLDLYEEAQQLVTLCSDKLQQAELRLEELRVTDDGELITTPLDFDEA